MWLTHCLLIALAVGTTSAHPACETPQAPAQEPQSGNMWAPLEFLLGGWTGEGAGNPGQGTGGFSFKWELDKKILMRTNYADYPATNERPAFAHHDLIVVYRDFNSSRLKAIYFDNEGHVINYSVPNSQDPVVIQFISDATLASPRYRLTYKKTGSATLSIKFEIAPPGKPEAFSTYIEATAHRR